MRECLFCDTQIYPNWDVCRQHYKYFLEVKKEPWLKEILSMERKQRRINKLESISLDNLPNMYQSDMILTKKIGRPRKIDHTLAIKMRTQNIPYREIAKLFNCHEQAIVKLIQRKAKYLVKHYTKRKLTSDKNDFMSS